MSKHRKICVVTGSRAEYGLFKKLLLKLKIDTYLHLQLIVTGSHLSSKHGFTLSEIKKDLIKIDRKIDIKISKDNSVGIGKSMSLGLTKLIQSYESLKPDVVLLLGDRYEILTAAIAATLCRIPIGHIHGGELTEGSMDDAFRHSITKMSHLHFAATKKYQKRIIQMGEKPKNVYFVGGLGVDNIKNYNFLSKLELEKKLKLKFLEKSILVTYHSETLNKNSSKNNFKKLLHSLNKLKNTTIIFTMPNSDIESNIISKLIYGFVKLNKNAFFFKSLGQNLFFSCCNQVNCMIGNSSSGLLEMPSFNKFTINLGDRQKGRIKANSVIDCKFNANEIFKCLNYTFKKINNKRLKHLVNPYGNGGSSDKIISILRNVMLNKIIYKKFTDLN